MDSDTPTDQRHLNLPAVQPVHLGEALGTPSSSIMRSTQFYVQPSPRLSSPSTRLLGKRPSTANLVHSSGTLLPASRRFLTTNSNDNLQDTRAEPETPAEGLPTSGWSNAPSGKHSYDELSVASSSNQQMVNLFTAEPTQWHPIYKLEHHELNEDESYDWGSFVQAYAAGHWDPRLTPNPPRNAELGVSSPMNWAEFMETPANFRSAASISNGTVISRTRVPGTSSMSGIGPTLSMGLPDTGGNKSAGTTGATVTSIKTAHAVSIPVGSSSLSSSLPSPLSNLRPEKFTSNNFPSVPRNCLDRNFSASSAAPVDDGSPHFDNEPHHDFHTAAATMRLAGDGIDIRPLALPSPEVELMDPFRGHTTPLPVPWSYEEPDQDPAFVLPSVSNPDSGLNKRRTRLNSFSEELDITSSGSEPQTLGRVEQISSISQQPPQTRLPSISASPFGTPASDVQSIPVKKDSTASQLSFTPEHFSPTITPFFMESQKPPIRNSFGEPTVRRMMPHVSSSDSPPSPSQTLANDQNTTTVKDQTLRVPSINYLPAFETNPASLQVQTSYSRSSTLHRTISEPIAYTAPNGLCWDQCLDNGAVITRPKSETSRSLILPRRVREEVAFCQRGYLIPPALPNERERQKALYRFNIVHTAKDANFDRIALLAKLVFNAKICLISLIDADEQWFKSEFGMGRETSPRTDSICGHTILQDYEPLVILDTYQDWRFAKNPFVVRHPHIRFYAGAPLRTAEGFNIGSLCVIDSEPRVEFGPRQRHTLKEFAAIVMRELELWRDKIQLRIRDRIQISMEQFTRECLEIDTQAQGGDPRLLLSSTNMEKIYDRAAQLVKRTLDVEGAVLIDVSSFEEFDARNSDSPVNVLLYHSDPKQSPQLKPLTAATFAQMTQFFRDFPDGKVSEAVLPACIRGLMPGNIHYALTVPILNIDKRPFAMLCAYNTNAKSKPYLEGHEMSYLRAIGRFIPLVSDGPKLPLLGVIILSAALKRRMILADKAKSLFISNISHELRTPLHGILAAAELLSGTDLSPNQASFLSTVQACGTSLVETVNHVLDFTKLSGSTKTGGAENNIRPAQVDLAQLVEEATEGCWIGHRARHSSEIGSVYSPPRSENAESQSVHPWGHVETIVDIGHRSEGWMVVCEKGGLRRCLMNLLGNALKFTTDGYVHVTLRQLQSNPDSREENVKIELGVLDSGMGISEEFLKNQLFQPFSQENPLQPGTGLGLAIVNSIVRSESVRGKIDVWSAEHFGTEIRIIFETPAMRRGPNDPDELGNWRKDGFLVPPSVSLLGFDRSRGQKLLKQVVAGYLRDWWQFNLSTLEAQLGDILILNEDVEHLEGLIEKRDCRHPLVLLSSTRGDPRLTKAVDAYELMGGFARIVFKPIGPNALRQVMRNCLRILRVGLPAQLRTTPSRISLFSIEESTAFSGEILPAQDFDFTKLPLSLSRRRSQEGENDQFTLSRPVMPERSQTSNLVLSLGSSRPSSIEDPQTEEQNAPNSPSTTISVGTGGLLLKSSVGSLGSGRPVNVLVIEDNNILRELLAKWLRSRGYIVREAADGQTGVDIFKSDIFDVVLLDMSMPILDGVGAAKEIRRLETERRIHNDTAQSIGNSPRTSRLIALTGMSTREDKRKAFEAGVDGYLVKPVSFKTLQTMFKQLGIT